MDSKTKKKKSTCHDCGYWIGGFCYGGPPRLVDEQGCEVVPCTEACRPACVIFEKRRAP